MVTCIFIRETLCTAMIRLRMCMYEY